MSRGTETYTIQQGNEVTAVEGRADAVKQAKEMSARGRTVRVERQDGRVRMVFQGGSLLTYVSDSGIR